MDLVGLMLSSNVPYKLASDKAFFEEWAPVETTESLSKLRLVAGMLPIRPITQAATLVRYGLQRLPFPKRRLQPRSTWPLPLHHEGDFMQACNHASRPVLPLSSRLRSAGVKWLREVLQPCVVNDTALRALARSCHIDTRKSVDIHPLRLRAISAVPACPCCLDTVRVCLQVGIC